jgi:hypothetical protein
MQLPAIEAVIGWRTPMPDFSLHPIGPLMRFSLPLLLIGQIVLVKILSADGAQVSRNYKKNL